MSGAPSPGREGPTAAATALALSAAALFGAIPIFTVLATRGGSPLLTTLVFRYGIAAVLLGAVAAWTAGFAPRRERIARLAGLGGAGQAAVAWICLSALDYIDAATLVFLFYTYPAWVAAIAAARGTDPLTPARAAALLLSLAGIATMVGAPSAERLHPIGVALALGAALLYGIYLGVLDRIQRGQPPVVTSAWICAGATAILAVAAAASGDLRVPPGDAWGAVAGIGVLSTTVAFLLFFRALAVLGAVRTAIVSTIEPFSTAILGALFLGQLVTVATMIGGSLIACAVLVLQMASGRRAAPAGSVAP